MYDLFIEKGAYTGDLPLHYAVYEGNMEKVKNLVEVRRIDVDSRSFSGETPLLLCKKPGNCKIFIDQRSICKSQKL